LTTILITGGAGFIGSHLALLLRADRENVRVIALDNLKRRGSEHNIARLRAGGVEFVHGDIRSREDLLTLPRINLLVEASAEPSVLAGIDEGPDYVINTNLFGTANCLELARRDRADVVFLSTSRVYPIRTINALRFRETPTRFELEDDQNVPGASSRGLTEAFPLDGPRSLYGATKLASELLLLEYIDTYGLRGVVNRCGILAGPWQMGKVDQGVIAFWLANHVYGQPLAYFGYGGCGLQVRDVLHVQDLYALLRIQLERMAEVNGQIYNIGGGHHVSVSLRELTEHCRRITGVSIEPRSVPEDRTLDIRVYLSDHAKATRELGWRPCFSLVEVLEEMHRWLLDNRRLLEPIFGGGSPGRI
jgi:CDP-paratose 2-epimerase